MRVSHLICLLGFTTYCTLYAQAQDVGERIAAIVAESKIPGAAARIFSKDSLLYSESFGYADIQNGTPYTVNTRHNIGSVSKTFIGIALMQLSESGKIDLDTDVNQYLPFNVVHPNFPESTITLRQLATHTSSIRDGLKNYIFKSYYLTDKSNANFRGLPFVSKAMLKKARKNEHIELGDYLRDVVSTEGELYRKKGFYKHEPGTAYEYSNVGAALAGYVVELVSGVPFADYVQENILLPLKLNETNYDWDSKPFSERYTNGVVIPKYNFVTYPDGGIVSSAADLSIYLMEMIRGYAGESDFLSATSFELMMQNQLEMAPEITKKSGLFWAINGREVVRGIGHSGSDPGITTVVFFEPKSQIGCVLISNCGGKKEEKALRDIWRLLIQHRDTLSNSLANSNF